MRAGLRTAARTAVPVVVWVAGGDGARRRLQRRHAAPRQQLPRPARRPASGGGTSGSSRCSCTLTVLTTLLMADPRGASARAASTVHCSRSPCSCVCAALSARLGDVDNLRFRTHGVAWFFVLGWLVQRSATLTQRLVTTTLCVLSDPRLLRHDRSVSGSSSPASCCSSGSARCRSRSSPERPRASSPPPACGSCITHFRVWPPLTRALPEGWAYVLTILVGVGTWAVVEQATRGVRRWQVQAGQNGWCWRRYRDVDDRVVRRAAHDAVPRCATSCRREVRAATEMARARRPAAVRHPALVRADVRHRRDGRERVERERARDRVTRRSATTGR